MTLRAFAVEAALFEAPLIKIPGCILVNFLFSWVLSHQLASYFKNVLDVPEMPQPRGRSAALICLGKIKIINPVFPNSSICVTVLLSVSSPNRPGSKMNRYLQGILKSAV